MSEPLPPDRHDSALDAPMAAGLLLVLKQECETQHTRADRMETALRQLAIWWLEDGPCYCDTPPLAGQYHNPRCHDARTSLTPGDYEGVTPK